MSEYHLLVVWETALPAADRILEDAARHFDLLRVVRVRWSPDLYNLNLSRFYGKKLPPGCHKEQECGSGPFLVLLLRDRLPAYGVRATSAGQERVNTRIFDAKARYRQWTGGGYRVHGTNTPAETLHDALLLFGLSAYELFDERRPPDFVDLGVRDLVGARGWTDLSEVFTILNALTEYVVLRNFEGIPHEPLSPEHGDIDLLVRDRDLTARLLLARRVFREPYRTHFVVRIGGADIPFDLRYLGDNYYDAPFEAAILQDRQLVRNAFFAPSPVLHFYSLLYHALVHKSSFSHDYQRRLTTLYPAAHGAPLPGVLDERLGWRLLDEFLRVTGFRYTEPQDRSVGFRRG